MDGGPFKKTKSLYPDRTWQSLSLGLNKQLDNACKLLDRGSNAHGLLFNSPIKLTVLTKVDGNGSKIVSLK